jgi:predicted RNase H-like HicB family nuclease
MSLPKEEIQKGFDMILKDIKDVAAKEGLKITKTSFKTWGKPFLKELGLEFGVPAVAQISNALTGFIVDSTPMVTWTPESLEETRKLIEKALQQIKGGTFEETQVKQLAVTNAVFNNEQLKNDLKDAKTYEEAQDNIIKTIEQTAKDKGSQNLEDQKEEILEDPEITANMRRYNEIREKMLAQKKTNNQTSKPTVDNKE